MQFFGPHASGACLTSVDEGRDVSIRVLLADDNRIVRDCLRSLVQAQSDMDVIGEAEGGETAVHLVEHLAPDVVVVDIGMPDLDGVAATRKILARSSKVKVIALSSLSEAHMVPGILDAGASKFLQKEHAFSELVDAIRTVVADQTCTGPQASGTSAGR